MWSIENFFLLFLVLNTSLDSLRGDTSAIAKHAVTIQRDGHIACTGSIIKPNVVLTAAACFPETINVKDFTVYGGTIYRIIERNSTAVKYGVKKVIVHPSYSHRHRNANVALVILSGKIDKSKNMSVIDISSKELTPKENCTLYGWGELFKGGPVANELHPIEVTVSAYRECVANQYYYRGQACLESVMSVAERSSPGEILVCDGKQKGVGEFRLGQTALFFVADVSSFREWIDENGSAMGCVSITLTLIAAVIGIASQRIFDSPFTNRCMSVVRRM